MIGRRGFLTTLAGATAGFVLDPERLLWKPGAKTIFLPPAKATTITLAEPFFKPGDIFTISGCYNMAGTKVLQEFVWTGVTAESKAITGLTGPWNYQTWPPN